MFGGLKEKLQAARNRLGSSIQGSAAAHAPPAAETKAGKPPQSAALPKTPSPATPSFTDKVKILIVDRELVVSEKDLAEALSELEMTLLECDVALQVTDAIIASVRTNLDREAPQDRFFDRRSCGRGIEECITRSPRHRL